MYIHQRSNMYIHFHTVYPSALMLLDKARADCIALQLTATYYVWVHSILCNPKAVFECVKVYLGVLQ